MAYTALIDGMGERSPSENLASTDALVGTTRHTRQSGGLFRAGVQGGPGRSATIARVSGKSRGGVSPPQTNERQQSLISRAPSKCLIDQ